VKRPKQSTAREFYYWQHTETGECVCVPAGGDRPPKAWWVQTTKAVYDQWRYEQLGRLAKGSE